MDRDKIISHARDYLVRLSEGKDPLTGSELASEDTARQERISKCLRYAADFFTRALDERGIGEERLYVYMKPDIKNEEKALSVASGLLERYASGTNPLTGGAVGENDIIKNDRISKCVLFTAQELGNAHLKKMRFAITEEQLEAFEYSDEPIKITDIKKRADALIDSERMTGISAVWIADYLENIKILQTVTQGQKKYRMPTKMGEMLGISAVEKIFDGHVSNTLFYSRKMQELIVKNIPAMIEKQRKAKTADNGEDDDEKEVNV